MEKIQQLAFDLHDQLMNSAEFLLLKEKEQIMFQNEISKNLIESYQYSVQEYGCQRNEENLKKMHLAKLAMDNNSMIQEYKKAYKNYQILVGEITDILFDGFSTSSLIDKIIRAK